MANPEHVALVRRGSQAVAEWWRVHRLERLDLSGSDLSELNLDWVNLQGANLSLAKMNGIRLVGANLHFACLSEADLGGADLVGAHLVGADLRKTNLAGANLGAAYLNAARLNEASLVEANLNVADLSAANLSSANLSFARLIGANLNQATLGGADLSQAQFGGTSLGNVDLSKASGLAAASHGRPSHIGVDTLLASFRGAGNKLTPELTTFFRNAGVPQELLDALPGIVSEIKYYSCFISYGQPDVSFASKLTEDLRESGVSCWFYAHDKTVGEHTQRDIAAARRSADKMIVVCSVAGLMRDGLLKEIEDQAEEDAEKLMPVSLDLLWRERNFQVARGGQDLKPFLLLKNYGYFASCDSEPERYQKSLNDLLKGLQWPKAKKARRGKKSS